VKKSVLIIAVLAFLSGCSSNPETNAVNGGANPPAANVNAANANTVAATNTQPSGEILPYNGVQNLNPNAFNASGDNLKVVPYKPKPGELPYGTRTAPDDSVVSTNSRGQDFVETRTFKNHPTLAKVEKIMDGKTTNYKVFLKNGKVVDAPADKMSNFAAMSPVTILAAIGIEPSVPAAANTSRKKDEKEQ